MAQAMNVQQDLYKKVQAAFPISEKAACTCFDALNIKFFQQNISTRAPVVMRKTFRCHTKPRFKQRTKVDAHDV